MEGLDCDTNWPDSWNAKSSSVAISKEGFYTLSSAPYAVYECKHEEDCPSGPPEYCRGGRGDLVCNACVEEQWFIDGEGCRECPAYLKLMVRFCFGVVVCGCTASYYATNGRLSVNADNPLAFFLFCGLVVTCFQVFGILKDMNIPWPTGLNGLMRDGGGSVTLDANSVSIECAVGKKASIAYLSQVLLPYGLLLTVWVLMVISKPVATLLNKPDKVWEYGRTLNVVGQIMQALFIAFCAIMVKPLQCYTHPNGLKSMLAYPRVLCWEPGEHGVIVALGICILVSFIIPFGAWCIWGCVKAPTRSAMKDFEFLRRFRFLLYRFRPDAWWWGLAFLLRQTVLAFVTIVPPKYPHAQLFYCGMVCTTYGFAICRIWPWLSPQLSKVDAGCMFILAMISLVAGQFLPEATAEEGRVIIMVMCFFAFVGLCIYFTMHLVHSIYDNGLFGEFSGKKPPRMELAKSLLDWLEYIEQLPNAEVVTTLCHMNAFDRQKIVDAMTCWNAVAGEGYKGKATRLHFIASKAKVDQKQVEHVAEKQGKRVSGLQRNSSNRSMSSTQESSGDTLRQMSHGDVNGDGPIKPHVENVSAALMGSADMEHNTMMPRSFRVLASSGTSLAYPAE
jgi:hypothetical protein